MYPGTIEMAAKLRYDAMVAEGGREQFIALNCVAPAGVWQFPIGVRQRVGAVVMRASTLLPRAHVFAGKVLARVTNTEQGRLAS